MKKNKLIMTFGVIGILLTSCEKEEDMITNKTTSETTEVENNSENTELEVEDFIYSGMEEIYLYKSQVPELADNYFSSKSQKFDYLETFSSPEELFRTLKSDKDRFSFLTDDYINLENRFNGISGSTGMKYGFGRISGTNNVFGYLQYILPGTSAEEAGLTRGTVFTEVNGQKLTLSNYQNLLDGTSISINTGSIVDGNIQMTNETVTLTDDHYTANPVYISKVLKMDGKSIGYLMYNSFIGDYDDELNAEFAKFKSAGISGLILDLRYNGGGSVESAADLASMITGQFKDEIFMKEQWNKKYQDHFESTNPEKIINRFDGKIRNGESINSLNLNKVYILTTAATASASELVINGLEPYIDVVQIGENTTGKFQASVTLYDSPDFSRENVNENHTYALQPLVFKSINSEGKSDYLEGLSPDISYSEDLGNMGTLGNPEEPLLKAAINTILGKAPSRQSEHLNKFKTIAQGNLNEPDFQRMYIEEVPPILNLNN